MRTIAPRTNFACRYFHSCVYCMHECLVSATMSFPHACTPRPHHCLQVLSPGLEPPGCRSGPRSTFLTGCVVKFSPSLISRTRCTWHAASNWCMRQTPTPRHLVQDIHRSLLSCTRTNGKSGCRRLGHRSQLVGDGSRSGRCSGCSALHSGELRL